MEQLDPTQIAARELLTEAERRGIDLRPLWRDWIFRTQDRMISFWHEGGKYHYALEGETGQPTGTPSYTSFWGESGTIEGVDDAMKLLVAWLVDRTEVVALPMRNTTSCGRN